MQRIQECLVIDDDQDDQEIFTMCLDAVTDGVNCTSVSDPTEAIKMLASNTAYTPDYIFIDVNMPKMNGIECLKILKDMDRITAAKIFMYSTSSEGKVLEESRRLGATDFIIKPSKTAELKERLSEIFERATDTNK